MAEEKLALQTRHFLRGNAGNSATETALKHLVLHCTQLYSMYSIALITNHQTSACFNHSLRPVQDAENQFSRVSPFSPRRMGKRMVLEFDDMSSCSTIRVAVPHQCVVLRSKSPPTSTAFKLEQNKQLNLELNGWL